MSRSITLRSDAGQLSFRLVPRTLVVALLLLALLLCVLFAGLALGSHPTSFPAVINALLQPEQSDIALIVHEIRLPRLLMAIIVGAALAVAGLILQGLVRNPLASPDVIGITGGASVATVLFLTLGGAQLSESWLPWVALLGALVVALIITLLSGSSSVMPTRLILIGVGLAAALGALTTLLIVLSSDATAMRAYVWLTGSLYASQWKQVSSILPWVALFLPLALFNARKLDLLVLGDQLATGLGSRLAAERLGLLVIAVALAGAGVAFAGGLSFIGLIAPHAARRLVSGGHTGLVIVSALLGSLMLVSADLIGRLAFAPRDLPAGIFVAAIGAPFFVYLLYRQQRQER